MNQTGSHKDLMVWRKSVALASRVYAVTSQFPYHERCGLTGQMQRAAVSVASSIAEGAGCSGRTEFMHFLGISRGALVELETQVLIALELKLIDRELQLEEAIAEVGRLLTALIQRLRERRERQTGSA